MNTLSLMNFMQTSQITSALASQAQAQASAAKLEAELDGLQKRLSILRQMGISDQDPRVLELTKRLIDKLTQV